MTRRIRVVCQQVAPVVGDLEANRGVAEAAIAEAVSLGADLVVLPELVLSGYVFCSREEVRSLALPRTSPVLSGWGSGLSAGGLVVGGFAEIDDDGRLYNSVAVVGREGVRAVYRKTHLWDEESRWFVPGDRPPPVLSTSWGRLGVLICYDLEFPEMPRSLAIRGADLIAAPTNWPLSERPPDERPPEVSDACSAARLNGVFVACCDRVGTERGVHWTGGSCVVDTHGWVVDERRDRDAGTVVADVVVAEARSKSLNENNHLMADRRPELYTALVDPDPA